MSNYIFVGPYAEAITEEIKIPYNYKTCLQSNCKNFKHNCFRVNFCDLCGTKLEQTTDSYIEPKIQGHTIGMKLELREVSGDMGRNHSKINHIWIYDNNYLGRNNKYDIEDEYFEVSFDSQIMCDEIAKFKLKFSADLECLIKHYNTISVKWGVFNLSTDY